MASLNNPRHGNESILTQQGGGATRFFKIILHSTISDKKLMIPRKFIRSHGSKLLRSATLEVPVGDKWEVELVTDRRKGVWFCNNGWQRFAEFYSLEYGHFLLFEYKGDSTFSVVICDTTATEIDYPVLTKTDGGGEEEEAAAQQPKEEEEAASKKKDKSPADDAPVSQMKKQRCNLSWEWTPCSPGNLNKTVKHEEKEGSTWAEKNGSGKPKSCWKELSPVAKEEEFTSENPFFTIRMTSSYATKHYLHIPIWFTREQRAFQSEKLVELEVGDKVWTVNLQCRKYVKLVRGWKTFVQDNSLKAGDVCVFELIKEFPSVSMKVTITRYF